ncbi:hypothetical protein [Flavobacterium sp.]|uniref:hypothetical protein n=1 Tax=Flavobacterium sp. TaxID=239 RepID=UPI002BB53F54|nr:hypothetical protein [Flavobacterium sp.]HSD09098.1 hypothetical protein [Flavobacterium sp.]
MSKKEKEKKDKKKKKDKKEILKKLKAGDNCKSTCCEKYMKSEKKRCSRCPMFDLIKKAS